MLQGCILNNALCTNIIGPLLQSNWQLHDRCFFTGIIYHSSSQRINKDKLAIGVSVGAAELQVTFLQNIKIIVAFAELQGCIFLKKSLSVINH